MINLRDYVLYTTLSLMAFMPFTIYNLDRNDFRNNPSIEEQSPNLEDSINQEPSRDYIKSVICDPRYWA